MGAHGPRRSVEGSHRPLNLSGVPLDSVDVSSPSPAIASPIARVLPLLGMPHLDRLFDYEVPEKFADDAQPGTRVRVRFAGRLVDAIVIERRRTTDHQGTLASIQRLISPQVVCTPELWSMVNELASRSAGVRSDILRTAIPPRHATAEKSGLFAGGAPWPELYGSLVPVEELRKGSLSDANSLLNNYNHGSEFLRSLLDGQGPHASLLSLPGQDPAQLAAAVAAATVWNAPEAGVLVLVPTQKAVDRVNEHLRTWVSATQITELSAREGPSERYRRYLSILQGQGRLVVGTRSAMLAPVQGLRVVIVLGEGDDNLVDPRAPYLHAAEVGRLHAKQAGAGFLTIGPHRTAEVQQCVEHEGMLSLAPSRDVLHQHLPLIRALGETDLQREREAYSRGSRIPALAFHAIRDALDAEHPVLIQVPRRGYAPALSCSKCRTPARCRHCNGPLELPSSGSADVPRCRWCGAAAGTFTCTNCGNHGLRMTVVGQDRTVEELGRAFSGVPIISSGGEHVRATVPHRASIVVATPGAEPLVEGGLYGAAVMLDPWIVLGKEDLRAQENAVRQWMHATSLVMPHTKGGRAVLTADASLNSVQAVIRWDPEAQARVELASRKQAMFPPAATVAAIDGTTESIEQLLEHWQRPDTAELLGPVELPPGVRLPAGLDRPEAHLARRMIVRVPHTDAVELGTSLKTAQAVRTTHKAAGPLRVVMNPVRIG